MIRLQKICLQAHRVQGHRGVGYRVPGGPGSPGGSCGPGGPGGPGRQCGPGGQGCMGGQGGLGDQVLNLYSVHGLNNNIIEKT